MCGTHTHTRNHSLWCFWNQLQKLTHETTDKESPRSLCTLGLSTGVPNLSAVRIFLVQSVSGPPVLFLGSHLAHPGLWWLQSAESLWQACLILMHILTAFRRKRRRNSCSPRCAELAGGLALKYFYPNLCFSHGHTIHSMGKGPKGFVYIALPQLGLNNWGFELQAQQRLSGQTPWQAYSCRILDFPAQVLLGPSRKSREKAERGRLLWREGSRHSDTPFTPTCHRPSCSLNHHLCRLG